MSTGRIKHLPISIRQRLQNLRDKTGEDYQLLLSATEEGGEYNQVWRDGGPWQPRSRVSREWF